jgi:hypothetical protein
VSSAGKGQGGQGQFTRPPWRYAPSPQGGIRP